MKETVYNFGLQIKKLQTVELPRGAKYLSIDIRVLKDPKGIVPVPTISFFGNVKMKYTLERTIEMFMPGEQIDQGVKREFLGSFIIPMTDKIFYVWERV